MAYSLLRQRKLCFANLKVFILPLLFISFTVLGQDDFKPTFGVIDKASLEMTEFPGDSTADAVFLYDYGEATFALDAYKGFVIKMKTWVRIKILKESALNRASVSLPYYEGSKLSEKEKLDDIDGYVYNLDKNEIVATAMDKKSIQIEKAADFYLIKKFNLPNVKKGSILEYTYTRSTPLAVQNAPEMWAFQGTAPIKWSEYRVSIPNFLQYHITLGGYLPFHINRSQSVDMSFGEKLYDGTGTAYRLVVKDSPAFINEPYITTDTDYISKVSFEPSGYKVAGIITEQFTETWDQVDRGLRNSPWFAPETNKMPFGKEVPESFWGNKISKVEKMNIGYNHIKRAMKWDKTSGLYPIPELKKAYENRKGNAAAVNMLLLGLLRKAGLECDPVLLSTRSHGRIFKEFPSLESFNYIICRVKIDSIEYLLDATQQYMRLGSVPEHALNGLGRLIPKEYQGEFLEIIPKDSRNKLEIIEAEIIPDEGSLKGWYSASLGGYQALDWREQYADESEKTQLDDDFKREFPDWKIEQLNVSNKSEKLELPVSLKCEFETDVETAAAGLFYFNPMLAGKMEDNPLKSVNRIYPLDFTTNIATSFLGKYTLPDGYVIEEMPKSEVISLPGGAAKFLYQVKQDGNIIQVSSKVTINKIKFLPTEYAGLREFFDRVVKKHSQPLVIKKKGN
ncbi:DUF3857 domain-containing protein [Dyadobacter pollutisoli]|uniref:DUF3857 domain-containing protein n=1 Tax=Dyadobacter pollutisoli TaxID=2910158 RepID=A0A9E8NAM9_9BACT|nr:DUF3857 domain-containing protein [Dyadobacter pollutisoli]WAC11572.1 DUF3857 domain-containing protein [Dyadobacter pollutisoli]